MKSSKTTVLGIIGAVTAILSAVKAMFDGDPLTNPDWTVTIAAVTSGIGLIFARDHNVTSEDAGLK